MRDYVLLVLLMTACSVRQEQEDCSASKQCLPEQICAPSIYEHPDSRPVCQPKLNKPLEDCPIPENTCMKAVSNISGVCEYELIDCNDGDACTEDTHRTQNSVCACDHTPVACDDGNDCTEDKCWAESGCKFEPIDSAICIKRRLMEECISARISMNKTALSDNGLVVFLSSAIAIPRKSKTPRFIGAQVVLMLPNFAIGNNPIVERRSVYWSDLRAECSGVELKLAATPRDDLAAFLWNEDRVSTPHPIVLPLIYKRPQGCTEWSLRYRNLTWRIPLDTSLCDKRADKFTYNFKFINSGRAEDLN